MTQCVSVSFKYFFFTLIRYLLLYHLLLVCVDAKTAQAQLTVIHPSGLSRAMDWQTRQPG